MKRHINLRIEEAMMQLVDELIKKYPRLSMATIFEMALFDFLAKKPSHQEALISKYLLVKQKIPK